MEYANAPTIARRVESASPAKFEGDGEIVRQRLDWLLEANAEIARKNSTFLSEREKPEALWMKNPLSIETTFARFGLLLGIFPPTAFFLRFFINSEIFQSRDVWMLGVAAVVALISAIVGYFSGKFIGSAAFELEKSSWSKMLLALPLVGVFWGIMAGGAGGIIIFGIGAIFGAVVGGLVGAAALPVFSIFHRLLKRGDKIETKHFLPLAFGIALIISAFILGM